MNRIRRDTAGQFAAALLLAGAIGGSMSACAGARPATEGPPNFGTVVEGRIYRGGQPDASDIERLRSLGVETILKLNTSRKEEEAAAARAAGIRFIHIPFDAKSIGNPSTCKDVARALEVMLDESNWPVYVHCSRGRDRAGYMVGLYRQVVQDWTWSRVEDELEDFGHTPRLRESFPQITRELMAGIPSCRSVVERVAGATTGDSPARHDSD